VIGHLVSEYVSVLLHYSGVALANKITFSSSDGSYLRSIASSDLNNDNRLDIVVANYGSNNIGVSLGCGDGTFSKQMMTSMGSDSHPYSIAIGDFNNDTKLDIAVANQGTNNVDMLLGNRMGAFVPQKSYESGSDSVPSTVVVGDFNNDGQSEIIVAYSETDNIHILVTYDTGYLENQLAYPVGDFPWSVAVGDFNNDTQLDIVVANKYDNNINVLLGCGNGSFTNKRTYSTGSLPESVAIGDFNNDFRLDIVVANIGNDTVSVFLGYGNGSFANQTTYSTADPFYSYLVAWPCSVTVGDFNNDTRLDIVVANNAGNEVGVLLGYGNGSFTNITTYSVCASPASVAVGDFNNDARLDIVVACSYSNNVEILRGYGNGSFENQITYSTGPLSAPSSVAVGDINNDKQLDIVVANNGDDSVSVFCGYGNGSFENQIKFSTGSYPNSVVICDLNKDNRLDIIAANSNDNNVGIFLGYGNGSFANQMTYSTGLWPLSIAVGDFNNDTRSDIVVANRDSNSTSVLLGYTNLAFVTKIKLSTGNGSQPQSFVICDFNNDTYMDTAVVNSNINNLGIYLGYGNYSFENQMTYPTGIYPLSVAVGDFNNDSRLDIVVANRDDDTVSVFLGYGNGSFSSQKMFPTGPKSQPYSVAVNDLNNDNLLDIVVVNYGTHTLGILLGNGNGTFADIVEFSIGYQSFPFSLSAGDFNNDGKIDVAVASEGTDDLKVFLQTC
jgi:predicted nucleotidyltransferase